MTRLVHSDAGYLRAMQMSGAQLFAFVEGGLDRPFIERLFKRLANHIRYQIIAAKELPGATGGKIRLVEWFKELRGRKGLASESWGKKHFSLFFLDKDADDFRNKLLRSDHVAYTPTYDIEGLVFNCADVHTAFADAALITTEQAKQLMPSPQDWIRDITCNWIDWTTLCLLSNFEGVNCGCGFNRPSDVNPDPLGAVDIARLEQYKSKVKKSLAISPEEFSKLYEKYRRRVESANLKGQYLRYFKGKWLNGLLQLHCERAKRVADWNVQSIGEKLTIALLAQVGNTAPCECCVPFHSPVDLAAKYISKGVAAT